MRFVLWGPDETALAAFTPADRPYLRQAFATDGVAVFAVDVSRVGSP